MIAPLDQASSKAARRRGRLHRAHRLVASTLFERHVDSSRDVPPIAAWRAWAFTGWVLVVTGIYLATMLGWF
ncbi:MAG: hypothetical protein HQ582_05940 [Planctomycetes bacterium]|nr:hypothetical protein [Planctomycetota bacterium]